MTTTLCENTMAGAVDPALVAARVEFGMAEAEVAQRVQWRSSALMWRAIDETLRGAAMHPEVFVDAQMLRGDSVEFAVRAAVADLAVRLNLAEATVRAQGHVAGTLRERMPLLWGCFVDGEVSTQNAREAAAVVVELPGAAWAAFDEQLVGPARTLTPARFKAKARALRETLHTRQLEERHHTATLQRGVWTELDRDGMGWLNAYLPVVTLAQITAQLDGAAFDLFTESDETRTMTQLRADVFADVLIGDADHSKVTVAITIPVLSLLGQSNETALLEGVGPIDLDTARRLTGNVPSVTRLLTHPVSGAVLQLDPTQYRVTAALKRWIRIQHSTCDFPGCGRRAINCDLDHTTARATGGQTTEGNLAPRCRKHHTMKHQTRWKVEQPPGASRAIWTSPTGHRREADPPPF